MKAATGFLLFAAALFHVVQAQTTLSPIIVPATFVFGDSIADVGNNNFLPGNESKANFAHNGIDFPGGKPTGRFSNGYNGIDHLAKKLGFEKSPPAYLSTKESEFEKYNGLNFASGGSGILDITGREVSIPLNNQIKYFQKFRDTLNHRVGSIIAIPYLTESLFVISTGSNDLFGYLVTYGLQNQTQQDLFIEQLASQFKVQLQTLHSLGARKFVVFGTTKLGCLPWTRQTMPNGECLEAFNFFSQKFNKAVQNVLRDLSSLKGFTYSFVSVYDIFAAITSRPDKYGFTDITSACCGAGKLNAETACTPNATYCSNRDQHLFWDRVHPTQATSKVIAVAAYQGRNYVTPHTVEKLSQISLGK